MQLTEVAYRGRRQLLCRISDGSGLLTLRFFYFSAAQQDGLARGTRLRCFGEVRRGPLGLEIVHPGVPAREPRRAAPLEETLTPIYPTHRGRAAGPAARAGRARRCASSSAPAVRDWLPRGDAARPRPAVAARGAARTCIARRARRSSAELAAGRHPAQRRLAFEELLAHQLSLQAAASARVKTDPALAACRCRRSSRRASSRALPFTLTGAQQRALAEVDADLGADGADGAPGAGRRRLRQDGGGRGGGGARRGQRRCRPR